MTTLSDELKVEFDAVRKALMIRHPDQKSFPMPLVHITEATLLGMTLQEAAEFIGERIILSSPGLRRTYAKYLWQDDGMRPPDIAT